MATSLLVRAVLFQMDLAVAIGELMAHLSSGWTSPVRTKKALGETLFRMLRRLHFWILGIVDGALYSSVMLLLVWQIRVYEDARNIREAAMFGHLPVQLTSNERWAPIVATWILLFAVAAPIVNHFWPRHRRRSIWFWEAVGLIAVSAWNVLLLVAFWTEKQGSGQTMSYDWLTSSSNPIFGPISLGLVLIVSFVYALVIQVFEKRMVQN